MAGVLVLLCVVLPLDSPHVSNLYVKIRMIFDITNTLKECLSTLQMSSVATHHSGDDKDNNEGESGKEDDEDDVVGGEQGGGGEEVGVHLPHLVGRISFMFLPTITNDKSVVCVDINCHRPFSSFSLSVAYILGGLLLFLLLKQLPPRVLRHNDSDDDDAFNDDFHLPQTAVGGFVLAMLATRLSSLDPIPGMGKPAI